MLKVLITAAALCGAVIQSRAQISPASGSIDPAGWFASDAVIQDQNAAANFLVNPATLHGSFVGDATAGLSQALSQGAMFGITHAYFQTGAFPVQLGTATAAIRGEMSCSAADAQDPFFVSLAPAIVLQQMVGASPDPLNDPLLAAIFGGAFGLGIGVHDMTCDSQLAWNIELPANSSFYLQLGVFADIERFNPDDPNLPPPPGLGDLTVDALMGGNGSSAQFSGLSFDVDWQMVPAPSGLSVLCIVGLGAARRRRPISTPPCSPQTNAAPSSGPCHASTPRPAHLIRV